MTFAPGAGAVLACEYCHTVVARKGAALFARGKLADLVDTGSPLQLGITGKANDAPFRLTAHLQKTQGPALWDEWQVTFDDGRTGWLSESEGALHLMSPGGVEQGLPRDSLRPGKRITFRNQSFTIEELDSARTVAAEGTLPDDLDPDDACHYADATGPRGLFLSLDYGTRDADPEVFIGRRVSLEELKISPDQLRPKVRKAELLQARCPQCDGPLPLRAPDRTRRVACVHCGALLDATEGKLSFLQALEQPAVKPQVPLGAQGTLGGTRWICIGFLRRSCVVENITYPWEEYLLFNPGRGFAWLTESSGHWAFLVPIPAGEVTELSMAARYRDTTYRAFSRVGALTEAVLGEFYWEVSAGEQAATVEYVHPPHSLAQEVTENEVTWSHGTYVTHEELIRAFALEDRLDQAISVGASQPNPLAARARQAWGWAAAYALAVLAIFLVTVFVSARAQVLEETVTLPQSAAPGSPDAMHFSAPFEIKQHGNVQVELYSPVTNDWVGIQGDLMNEETGEVISFYSELSYYTGSDSDGVWTEGGQRDEDHLSSVSPGRYVLRTTLAEAGARSDRTYRVRLLSDVPRPLWVGLAWLALLVWPTVLAVRSSSIETRRWQESNLVHLTNPRDDD